MELVPKCPDAVSRSGRECEQVQELSLFTSIFDKRERRGGLSQKDDYLPP